MCKLVANNSITDNISIYFEKTCDGLKPFRISERFVSAQSSGGDDQLRQSSQEDLDETVAMLVDVFLMAHVF